MPMSKTNQNLVAIDKETKIKLNVIKSIFVNKKRKSNNVRNETSYKRIISLAVTHLYLQLTKEKTKTGGA